ncbi:MAG: AAA family ATPase [Xanthobacteraceae bacterium]
MFVIFDLDGTLADIEHRVHHVRDGKREWDEFFAACSDDRLHHHVRETLDAHLARGNRVEIWSGRSDVVRAETETWLIANRIDPDLLTHMRAEGDNTPDVQLKRFWLNQLHDSERPDLVYDDRQRVVDMWRDEGIPCFQVTANWDANERVIAPTRDPLLTLLIGPAGAGKSTFAKRYRPDFVLSSDQLREDYCGDFTDQSRNADVFTALHRIAAARLSSGLKVVVDATNLRRRDRLALVALAPPAAGVEYIVIDRPLDQKMATAGWRTDVMVGGKTLVEAHHERMKSALKDILKGDDLLGVRVRQIGAPRSLQPTVDLRTLAVAA